ncbi:MAG: ferredoxin [Peptococcaceae bacterium]|jgi:Fe-S-cluster-containing hydrogenase component 2|nr:ferredoxin [Peptococcaceae bacterium]
MLANYGYQDGSGEFFITIDTGWCAACAAKGCQAACPAGVLEVGEDDYGDMAASVREEHRRKVRYSCAPCKPGYRGSRPPCQEACAAGAIRHSW